MKSAMLALILASSSAFAAAPRVGYLAKLFVKDLNGPVKYEVFEAVSYDAKERVFIVDNSLIYPDETKTTRLMMIGFELLNPEVLKECAGLGGRVETIEVQAGRFEACKTVSREDGNVIEHWAGLVPFSTIKEVWSDSIGGITTTELVEYAQ